MKRIQIACDLLHVNKFFAILILTFLSVFNNASLANQVSEDLQAYFKCLEKNINSYCGLRHSDEGRVWCVNTDKATAIAVHDKNNGLLGKRNDCIFDIEIAQFTIPDGVAVIRANVKPNEIFSINFALTRKGGIFAACRSPLMPVYDTEASRLDYRCVKK